MAVLQLHDSLVTQRDWCDWTLWFLVAVQKKNNEPFDDPILDAIKAPDENKWIWYSPRSGGRKPKKLDK